VTLVRTRPNPYALKVSYEKRIGAVMLGIHKGREEPEAIFQVPLSTILRDLGIPPEAFREAARWGQKPQEDAGDPEAVHRAAVPEDCTGLTVLDIGGYHGKIAKLCLERGAESATVLDSGQYEHYGWPEPERLPGVVYERGDFRDWRTPADLVFFLNVIYHVKDPWTALEHLRTITRREMVLCSLVIWNDQPVWEVDAPREVNPTDETVYWSPSEAGLRKLLAVTGWKDVEEVGHAYERLVLRCR
jgi:tRNA (mo5U34)-methyltransferase